MRAGRQRSAKASLAPSATKAAAKLRRIQVRTRGREITWLRIGGGEEAVADEDHEGQQHEDAAQLQHARQRMRLVGVHELRQEG